MDRCSKWLLIGFSVLLIIPARTAVGAEPSRQSVLRPEPRAWVIEVETSGGRAATAHGARITSEGRVEITMFHKVTCGAQLLMADLREIEIAVSSAKPAGWKEEYRDPEGRFVNLDWRLTFQRREAGHGERTYRTFGDGNPGLPGDLEAMSKAVGKIRRDVQARCRLHQVLDEISAGRGDLKPLVVTYDDLHGLWGGLRLTIRGTGQVEQTAIREKAGATKKVSRQDLVKLADLLAKHAAWEQRTPERSALPDESRASLTIGYDQTSTTIWEWRNDLEKNHRIGDIRDLMKRIAWKSN